jgi:dolichyl-diphosphooligosaccharide---protein glycosyltransferase
MFWQALGVFGLCQLHCFVDYLRGRLSTDDFQTLFKATIITAITILATITGVLTITGIFSGVEC